MDSFGSFLKCKVASMVQVFLNGPRLLKWSSCFNCQSNRLANFYMASYFCRLQRFISSPSKIDRAYQSTMSVCLSVPPPNSLQTQHIDLKLSTLLFEAKSGAKFEDGQNWTKFFHVMGTSSKPKLGLWGKKFILSE